MRSFQDYVFEARKKKNIYSNNKLAKEIDIAGASLSVMMNNKTLPAEETLIKIADLAGIPREEALLDLSIWRAKSDDVKNTWEKIRELLKIAAMSLIIIIFFSTSASATELQQEVSTFDLKNVEEYILCQQTGKKEEDVFLLYCVVFQGFSIFFPV